MADHVPTLYAVQLTNLILDVPLVGAAGQFPVGASQCRYGTSRSDLGERWPARLVATAAEDRLNIPPTN